MRAYLLRCKAIVRESTEAPLVFPIGRCMSVLCLRGGKNGARSLASHASCVGNNIRIQQWPVVRWDSRWSCRTLRREVTAFSTRGCPTLTPHSTQHSKELSEHNSTLTDRLQQPVVRMPHDAGRSTRRLHRAYSRPGSDSWTIASRDSSRDGAPARPASRHGRRLARRPPSLIAMAHRMEVLLLVRSRPAREAVLLVRAGKRWRRPALRNRNRTGQRRPASADSTFPS